MFEISIPKAWQAEVSVRESYASLPASSVTTTLIKSFIRGLGLRQLLMHLALDSKVPPLQSWQTNSNLMYVMSDILARINRRFLVMISGDT